MRFKGFLLIGLVILLLGGCGSKNVEPVAIDYGTDTCDSCHMGIGDEQASAQLILTDGTPKKFDDIGCLVTYMQESKETIEKAFVHDHETSEWIEMDTAYFVQSHEIESPMSYGIYAFSNKKTAETWQQEHNGTIFSKDHLLEANMKEFKKDMTNHHD